MRFLKMGLNRVYLHDTACTCKPQGQFSISGIQAGGGAADIKVGRYPSLLVPEATYTT
jgi:hypothetical protein